MCWTVSNAASSLRKKPLTLKIRGFKLVGPPGLELGTKGL
jgi:hypothetical protein